MASERLVVSVRRPSFPENISILQKALQVLTGLGSRKITY
jgi:hypothetical protein